MTSWLILLLALVSTGICLFLWFRDVRRVMTERKSTVESAAGHLTACREKARKARGDPEAEAILDRSKKIYQQAVDIYNRTLQKPCNYLPAHLMGFHLVS